MCAALHAVLFISGAMAQLQYFRAIGHDGTENYLKSDFSDYSNLSASNDQRPECSQRQSLIRYHGTRHNAIVNRAEG